MKTLQILNGVLAERDRQDAKWGEQNHPDGTSPAYTEAAALQKECVDRLAANGELLWSEILLEEIYEAYCETDPERLVEELIHSIAVTFSWIEAIGRRNPTVADALAKIYNLPVITDSSMEPGTIKLVDLSTEAA